MRIVLTIWLRLFLWAVFVAGDVVGSEIKKDERVVFFPTTGRQLKGEDVWECEVQGVIFEPEQRRISVAILREALAMHNIKLSEAEDAIFKTRTRAFMVDHERNKNISIKIGDEVFPVGKSGPNGRFGNKVRLTSAQVLKVLDGKFIPFTAVLSEGDERIFSGAIILLADEGVSIISDIDDTIKISQVRERKELLANTFYRPFAPVPGMAELYHRWEETLGADVHYVSASPWQLFEILHEFTTTNGFPAGAFHLKQFRVKDETFFSLFKSPETYKLSVIEPLLKQFPERKFILVGDSGEKDPEVYGTIARRYADQIRHIYIRDVSGEPADSPRYAEAFKGLPSALWQVFKEPGEVK